MRYYFKWNCYYSFNSCFEIFAVIKTSREIATTFHTQAPVPIVALLSTNSGRVRSGIFQWPVTSTRAHWAGFLSVESCLFTSSVFTFSK